MRCAECAHRLEDGSREGSVVTAIRNDRHPRDADHDAIEEPRGAPLEPPFTQAPPALCMDDVVTRLDRREHLADHLGWVLQIGVDGDDDIAAREVEPRGEGDLMPPVLREVKHPYTCIGAGQRVQLRRRRVGGAIVHEEHLELALGKRGREIGGTPVEGVDGLGLVVAGDHKTDLAERHAGGRSRLQYHRCVREDQDRGDRPARPAPCRAGLTRRHVPDEFGGEEGDGVWGAHAMPSQRKTGARPMPSQRKTAAAPSKRAPVVEHATAPIPLWAWAALLLVVTLVAFAPTFGAQFIKWDDQFYVEENPLLPDPDGLRKIWDPISREAPEYYPILFGSYWLEYRLWGLDPRPYHATTLALHLANVGLVLLLARRLGAAGWVAAGAAALFAVHPVQVASVAWISEQKNTLSGLFYLVAFLLYLRHRRTGRWGAYGGCLASFVAALLSKTQTVTFPVSLVLAEWLLLRRREVPLQRAAAGVAARVAPMFALCIPAGLLTMYFDQHPHTPAFPLVDRLVIASNAVWFYLRTFLAPVRLSPVYAAWHPVAADPSWWMAAVGLCLGSVALGAAWRHIPALTRWGMLHFLVSLLPVLGFVPFTYETYTMVADHFLYLPCIGGGVALAAGVDRLLARLPSGRMVRRTAAAVGVLIVAACAAQ